jgi:hypothetical protein
MMALRLTLRIKLQIILSSTFTIRQIEQNKILFKSLKINQDEFYLYPEVLTEYEILEVAKILAEVYSEERPDRIHPDWRFSASRRDLNLNSAISGQLVGTVVGLKGSALHRLLLLTSGSHLLSKESSDLVINLAQNKKETCSDLKDMSSSPSLYGNLKNLYILPGIALRTPLTSSVNLEDDVFDDGSIELTSKLAAFFANNSESLTLGEHLKLNFDEAIATQKSLTNFERLTTLQRILRSDYRTMAESMTAAEVNSLTYLLPDFDAFTEFPVNVLRSRSTALSQAKFKPKGKQFPSVLLFLSVNEAESVSSLTFITKIDNLVTDYSRLPMTANLHRMVYAALAEVKVVKGERRALDVANELIHVRQIRKMTPPIYSATVALIAEALKPENDDFPFSWTAQMSEHSWVLVSHKADKNKPTVEELELQM